MPSTQRIAFYIETFLKTQVINFLFNFIFSDFCMLKAGLLHNQNGKKTDACEGL